MIADSLDTDILFTSNDTFELMRILEEVTTNSTFASREYLDQLRRHLMKPEGTIITIDYAVATRKLEEVRLALARNLARALVVGFDNPF